MRSHLFQCIEARDFYVFPNTDVDRADMFSQIITHVGQLFCTCSMLDDGTYFACTECEQWCYPNCQGMGHKTVNEINKMEKNKWNGQSKKVKMLRNKRK